MGTIPITIEPNENTEPKVYKYQFYVNGNPCAGKIVTITQEGKEPEPACSFTLRTNADTVDFVGNGRTVTKTVSNGTAIFTSSDNTDRLDQITAIPHKENYAFSPTSTTISCNSDATLNGTEIPACEFTLQCNVDGTTVDFVNNGQTVATKTVSNGAAVFTSGDNTERLEQITAVPSKEGYIFTPSAVTIGCGDTEITDGEEQADCSYKLFTNGEAVLFGHMVNGQWIPLDPINLPTREVVDNVVELTDEDLGTIGLSHETVGTIIANIIAGGDYVFDEDERLVELPWCEPVERYSDKTNDTRFPFIITTERLVDETTGVGVYIDQLEGINVYTERIIKDGSSNCNSGSTIYNGKLNKQYPCDTGELVTEWSCTAVKSVMSGGTDCDLRNYALVIKFDTFQTKVVDISNRTCIANTRLDPGSMVNSYVVYNDNEGTPMSFTGDATTLTNGTAGYVQISSDWTNATFLAPMPYSWSITDINKITLYINGNITNNAKPFDFTCQCVYDIEAESEYSVESSGETLSFPFSSDCASVDVRFSFEPESNSGNCSGYIDSDNVTIEIGQNEEADERIIKAYVMFLNEYDVACEEEIVITQNGTSEEPTNGAKQGTFDPDLDLMDNPVNPWK